MKNSIFSFFLFLIILLLVCPASSFAGCIGSVPIVNTNDTWESCKRKSETPPPKTNTGPGSGENNINVFQSPLTSSETDKKSDQTAISNVITRHQVRIELAPYVIPGAYQFDDPGMTEKLMFNGAAWEYYLNKSFAIGFLYQEWAKAGGRDFKTIQYTDASGDVHNMGNPGAIDRLKYTSYLPYVSVNANLAPRWALGLRFGLGHVGVEAEYKDSSGESNKSYEDNTSMLFDMFLQWRWDDALIGGNVRYINARNDTDDYLEYMNMGSAQIVIYVQWMLRPLGLL